MLLMQEVRLVGLFGGRFVGGGEIEEGLRNLRGRGVQIIAQDIGSVAIRRGEQERINV
jgi:hypothetical protein